MDEVEEKWRAKWRAVYTHDVVSAVFNRVAELKCVAELDTMHSSKGKLAPLQIPEPLQNEMLSLLSVSVCLF